MVPEPFTTVAMSFESLGFTAADANVREGEYDNLERSLQESLGRPGTVQKGFMDSAGGEKWLLGDTAVVLLRSIRNALGAEIDHMIVIHRISSPERSYAPPF
jgi:hypothetical protein